MVEPYPSLNNMKVNWEDYSQCVGKKKTCSKPPTRFGKGPTEQTCFRNPKFERDQRLYTWMKQDDLSSRQTFDKCSTHVQQSWQSWIFMTSAFQYHCEALGPFLNSWYQIIQNISCKPSHPIENHDGPYQQCHCEGMPIFRQTHKPYDCWLIAFLLKLHTPI